MAINSSNTNYNPSIVPQAEHIMLRLSADANMTTGTDVAFNVITSSNNMAYTSPFVTLKANRTYEINVNIGLRDGDQMQPFWSNFAVVDSSNVQLSPEAGTLSATSLAHWTNGTTISFLYTPTVDTNIKLRHTAQDASAGTLVLIWQRTSLSVKAISGTLPSSLLSSNTASGISSRVTQQVITLDNIKFRSSTATFGGFEISAVSTPFTMSVSAYTVVAGAGIQQTGTFHTRTSQNLNITTTAWTDLWSGGQWATHGSVAIFYIMNQTTNQMYKISVMISGSYLNNPIHIERLV
jgi:hypothetical protein